MGSKKTQPKTSVDVGTNRIVILLGRYAYKYPLGERGKQANQAEYANYLKHRNVVAKTKRYPWGLRQERLSDITIYKLGETKISEEHQHLLPYLLHNRMQIGKDRKGRWKYFDYEDVKYLND